jgi:hypothetical protein
MVGRSQLAPALLLILLLAALLRAQFLMQPLTDWFTWREASTAMMADNLPGNGWNPLWPEVSWTGDQVGYQGREFQVLTVFAALLDAVFGWRDWHGRLIAMVFGLVSVLALHQIVLHLYGVAKARAAAFILAVMPGMIVIDSSYLPDPAMLALMLASFWALICGLTKRSPALLATAGLLGMFGLLAKLPGIAALPAAAYLAWTMAPPERRVRDLLLSAAAILLLSIPIIAYYRWAVYLGTTYPPFHIAGSGYIWEDGFAKFLGNKLFLGAFRNHARDWLWTWPIIILATIGLLLPSPHATGDDRSSTAATAPFFFHVWLAGCAVFYVVAARQLTDNPWNFHIFNPAVAAMSGSGLLWIGTGGRRLFSSGAWLRIAAVAVLALYAGYTGSKIPKDPFANGDYLLGVHLGRISRPGDLVVVSGSDAGNPVAIYYSRRKGWIFPPPPEQPDYMYYLPDGAPAIRVLEELRQRGARWFGVVKAARDYSEPRRLFVEHHAGLLSHLAETALLVADEPSYLIYSLKDSEEAPPAK